MTVSEPKSGEHDKKKKKKAQAVGNDNIQDVCLCLRRTKNKLFFLSIPILYLLLATYVLKKFRSFFNPRASKDKCSSWLFFFFLVRVDTFSG